MSTDNLLRRAVRIEFANGIVIERSPVEYPDVVYFIKYREKIWLAKSKSWILYCDIKGKQVMFPTLDLALEEAYKSGLILVQ